MKKYSAIILSILTPQILTAEECFTKTTDANSWYHVSDSICFHSKEDPLYGWLSNHFTPAEIVIDDARWPSVEHYFQYKKLALVADPAMAKKKITAASTENAKELANDAFKKANLSIKSHWRRINLPTMALALEKKFTQNNNLKNKLLATGGKVIIFNDHDKIWGAGDDGKGYNHLGRMLMWVRKKLHNQKTPPYDTESTFKMNTHK